MNAFTRDYEAKYKAMRAAAVKVEGDMLRRLTLACQDNDWLRVGGIDFEPEGFCPEGDYPYCLERYDDVDSLAAFFEHGNWSIRAAVMHRDLIFVNQVNGGDEWWTLKIAGDELLPFESITFRPMIARGQFADYIERLCKATPELCKNLDY